LEPMTNDEITREAADERRRDAEHVVALVR
jgi:hypothetical protein